jgi:uncharacterized protein YegL
MKKGYTKIAVVLDGSSSMNAIREATISGFNEFLDGQQQTEGEASLTLAQFSYYNKYKTIYNDVNIKNVSKLNMESYVPNGMTALYDAVCRTIDTVGEELHQLRESSRPEKVVFVIITDGEENNSREFSHEDMVSRITHQREKYNWEFVYIGANQDALEVARKYAIPVDNAMTYTGSAMSVGNTYRKMSENLAALRTNKKADMSYTEQDRKEQEALDNK